MNFMEEKKLVAKGRLGIFFRLDIYFSIFKYPASPPLCPLVLFVLRYNVVFFLVFFSL